MYGRYKTHYFCSICQTWLPHEVGNICPDCNLQMRSRPRDARAREKFLAKHPLHKGRNIK